jgi:glycosyltransferase involved in cell wall biosynthesis
MKYLNLHTPRVSKEMDEVTVVVTACGRPDLLQKTIETFLEHNKYPIYEWILHEDSGIPNINKELEEKYPTFTWISSAERQGQIKSIDICYSRVKTPYIFHLEDDWETLRGGMIEESLDILKNHPKISAIMCREQSELQYHMSDTPPILKCWGEWGHWSFNPGLRRLSDYKEHFPNGYNAYVSFDKKDPLKGEFFLNAFYRENGYNMGLTKQQHVRHIGDGRHIGEVLSLPCPIKIGLCMIVKNESHIIHESLNATLNLVDTFCITDTGSTDNTVQLIEEFYRKKCIPGTVCHDTWKDFGTNRTTSLRNCDGKMDYILVIDADDLITFPENGKQILQDILVKERPNSCIIQVRQGDLKYVRAQIFKANDDWKYKGVLHEYPTNDKPNNKTITLPDTFWMESRRLGDRNRVGNKAERDIQVLLKGVQDEPDNERYVFYLAQSYRDNGDLPNAIKWYKKRYHMDRWIEEKWYSAYQVGIGFKHMGNIPSFEKWMNIAFQLRPSRAEPLHHLAQYFREKGQFYKAYHYIQLGRVIPESSDSLFVETYSYRGGFDYEASVVEFYVNQNKKVGLRSAISYLLKQSLHQQNVLSNMRFYVEPIQSESFSISLQNPFDFMFRPTAISLVNNDCANVRFVNYNIPTNGEYETPDGSKIQTKNAYMNIRTGECLQIMKDDISHKQTVCGYEDVRVFQDSKFFASSYKNEYNNHIHMMCGDYDIQSGRLWNTYNVESPYGVPWEKNWLPIPTTNNHIYGWSPLRIGTIEDKKWKLVKEIETPPLFSMFRGSAPPVEMNGKWVALVHLTEYSSPRMYYHMFVELDKETYKPLRISLPFVFRQVGIEYCISMRVVQSKIECFATLMDADPRRFQISDIEWIQV